MCTLTYIPYQTAGYTLTHNRDEHVSRPASNDFKTFKKSGQVLYFPQDLEAKGSWMAFSDLGIATCVLNGGSKKYKRKPLYRKSRGIVVLESFDFPSIATFYSEYDFSGLEPFTLIRIDKSGLFAIIHDEDQTAMENFDPSTPQIWSSTTLYEPAIRSAKEKVFKEWLSNIQSPDPEDIISFHLKEGNEKLQNKFTIDYGGFLKTVSLTQIAVKDKSAHLKYLNLVNQIQDRLSVDLLLSGN